MKREINVFEHSAEIFAALKNGVLLTAMANGKLNAMTISWGTLGIEWGKPIFTAFVREHRYSRELLEKNGEFTISIPAGDYDHNILKVCGSESGRDKDKIKLLGLTPEKPLVTSVPGFKELPLTLECRVVYKQLQVAESIIDETSKKFYPQDVDSFFHGSNKDYHVAYYGEIVASYVNE